MVADILASEYHWGRDVIWWELDFAEIALYLQCIIHRKAVEAGQGSAPVTDEMAELWEVIERVKEEKRRK
jgi:hypothetical protein